MEKTENPFLATLRLPVQNSPILLIVLIVQHFVCLLLPWLSGLMLHMKIILTCAVVVSMSFYLYRYKFCIDNKRVAELILNTNNDWQVKMSDGAAHHATLDHHLFIHPWLTVISLIYDNSRKYFILTPEILDADLFRRLRVRLRFQVGE